MTSEELIELENKRILEIVGIWLLEPDTGRYKWLRENGWNMVGYNSDTWANPMLGKYWESEDGAFKIELKRVLTNPKALNRNDDFKTEG